jgi:SAM-dependent methyltransferase
MEVIPFQPYQSYKDMKALRNYDTGGKIKEKYWKDYGFTLISQEQIQALVSQLKGMKVLDAGSGSGFISYELKLHGVNVTAIDNVDYNDPEAVRRYGIKHTWHVDIVDSAVKHLPGDYDAVILAWPPLREAFGWKVAAAMEPGQILFYQGEGQMGCTADERFHKYVSDRRVWRPIEQYADALNEHQAHFINNYDYWSVYQKTRK